MIWKCTCVRCGHRMDGDKPCFDLSGPVSDGLRKLFDGDSTLSGAIDTLEQNWNWTGTSPAKISEQLLKQWTGFQGGSASVELRLSVRKWLPLLQAWLEAETARLETETTPQAAGQLDFADSESPPDSRDSGNAPGRRNNDTALLFGKAMEESLRNRPEETVFHARFFPIQESGDDATRILRFGMQEKGRDGRFFARRFCPRCGAAMPPLAGRHQELLVVVLGREQSGKSAGIAACADYFLHRDENEGCGIRWEPGDGNEDWETFRRNCLEPYRRGLAPVAAARPAFSVGLVLPATEMTPQEETLALTVAELVPDVETLDRKESERQRELCANAEFAVLCADERILHPADAEYAPRLNLRGGRSLSPLLRQCARLFAENRTVCAAFVLSKSDTMQRTIRSGGIVPVLCRLDYRLNDPDGSVRAGLTGLPFVQLNRYHRQACILRGYLRKKLIAVGQSFRDIEGVKTVLNEFESVFPRHTYLSVSAFGFNPAEGAGAPRSSQAEWPLLWMLAVRGDLMARDGSAAGFSSGPDRPEETKGAGRLILDNLCMTGECNWEYQLLAPPPDSPF